MKKSVLALVGLKLVLVSSVAHALRDKDVFFVSTVLTTVSPFLPTSSGAIKNDIVQVQGDAIEALETGVMSPQLKSVVDRLRVELQGEDIKLASDLEIVEMIADGQLLQDN